MGKSTTFGYWRQRGDNREDSFAAVDLLVAKGTTDGAQATATDTGITLPIGAIPVGAQAFGGANGNSATIKIGTSTASELFAADIDAINNTAIVATGSGLGTALTAQTKVYTRAGGSATGGGLATSGSGNSEVTFNLYYHMNDNGI